MYDLTNILTRLYASEINCGVESFWDGGFTVFLGDSMNGRAWETTISTAEMVSAGHILASAAMGRYPDSEFARWHNSEADRHPPHTAIAKTEGR